MSPPVRSLAPTHSSSLYWIGGTIKLASLDPFDSPIIDPNYLSTDFDIKAIVAALKVAIRFNTAPSLQGFIGDPWEGLAAANTDEELAQYARNYSSVYVGILNHLPLGYSDISGWV